MLQDVATFEETQETLALLKILALSNQDVAAGKVKPVADVVGRLRSKRVAHRVTALDFAFSETPPTLPAGGRA